MVSTSTPFSTGAGYVILVTREVSGLSQRKLATRMRTSQPTVAKLEPGSRMLLGALRFESQDASPTSS